MVGTPLDQLCKLVDPGACHLVKLPNRIWLFGGPVPQTLPDPTESLRHSFCQQSLSLAPTVDNSWLASLDRPENYNEWWAFSGYDDLLQFERDACYLARKVILFAESPGALAELGALAIDPVLVDQLIVVVQTKYFDAENRQSFLNLGPLKRISDRGNLCVIGTADEKILELDDVQLIVESVHQWLPPLQRKKALSADNPTHCLLLLADLVDLLLVSKIEELKHACAYFGVLFSVVELNKALKLLEFFELIGIEHRGTESFYVRRNSSEGPWVDYTGQSDEIFDRSRFKIDCQEWVGTQTRRKIILERER